MALGPLVLKVFVDLKKSGSFADIKSVMEIGSTDVESEKDIAALEDFLRAFGVNPEKNLVDRIAEKGPARLLFETVGFKYGCIDFDGRHGALQLDLNWDSVPREHYQAYDLVMNLGTSEHVMNQFNVFKVLHDLTKPGGYMLHDVPFLGFLDHGLFVYSARMVWHLCRENNYVPVFMCIEADTESFQLPENIRASFEDFYGNFSDVRYQNAAILALLRKTDDREFVCPTDVSDVNWRPPAGYGRGYGNFLDECRRMRLREKVRIVKRILIG
ncbi:MAG: hypothetical protein HY913_09360 [Desulfomonile tiedjei]|nr:hypothetical protein [Desulfomonile tiedjei]